MPAGRPTFKYFVFDCPSDHEIDGSLHNESDAIRSVAVNKNLGTQFKSVRCTTPQSFNDIPGKKYSGVKYVHLGGHGSKSGLGFIGGFISWANVATKLVQLFPKLKSGEQRVLTLSCCYSKRGFDAMKPTLQGHFTAAYHFSLEEVAFSTAITTWCMFYLKKKYSKPHGAIKDQINEFMGKDFLVFKQI